MKKALTIIFLMFFCFCVSQTTKEEKITAKIDKQILNKKVTKKELSEKVGWAGGNIKLTIYLKNNVPILIEKVEKKVKHLYLTDGTEKDHISYITAKFYILNWEKNEFLRNGEIINLVSESEKKIIEIPENYVFNFERDKIEKLIKSNQ